MCSQAAQEHGGGAGGEYQYTCPLTLNHFIVLMESLSLSLWYQREIAHMLVEVCSQERSYLRFFGLLGQVSHLLCLSCVTLVIILYIVHMG